jgi:Zn-dependent protease with chaperone function
MTPSRARLRSVTRRVALREQSHRRLTLLAIAALLLLSTGPVVGHHLPIDATAVLAGVDHIGSLCVAALHLLLEPVHYLFHAVIAGGLLYATWDRLRAWRTLRRVLRAVDGRVPAAGDPFRRAAVEAGLDPANVRVVRGLPNPAFTAGLVSPRVYVAESIAEMLSPDELTAVLAHERAHVTRRDPLRLMVLRALACTLFWIPALRKLADDMADEAEVLADDAAAGSQPLVLAAAILTLAHWPDSAVPPSPVAGFLRSELLDRRIRRLAGEDTPVRSRVTVPSIVAAAAALALVWSSGVLVAHPLPATSPIAHERHCEHEREWAISHLFCLGSPFSADSRDCPHQQHA